MLLRFGGSLVCVVDIPKSKGCVKYVSLNNQSYQPRTTLIDVNSDEPVYWTPVLRRVLENHCCLSVHLSIWHFYSKWLYSFLQIFGTMVDNWNI